MAFGPPTVQTLIDEYYTGLYRYAYRLSGSAADAEDLTQETFRKALARLGQKEAQDELLTSLGQYWPDQLSEEEKLEVLRICSLAFSRMVVEAHGGSIWTQPNPEGGSLFAFRLPLPDHG